jgi:hypothetical protein
MLAQATPGHIVFVDCMSCDTAIIGGSCAISCGHRLVQIGHNGQQRVQVVAELVDAVEGSNTHRIDQQMGMSKAVRFPILRRRRRLWELTVSRSDVLSGRDQHPSSVAITR